MPNKTLKNALLANALFSTLSGFIFILDSQIIADLIGIGAPFLYQIIGGGLLIFALYIVWTATRNPINLFGSLLICLGDILWVVATILVILFAYGSLNGGGILAMSAVGLIVLMFALWQLRGIENQFAIPNKATVSRICVAIDTPEPADKMWPIVADIANIDAYSPHLTNVILRDGANPGVDAVRQCTDDKGKTWAEHCTRYDDDARVFDVEFLADEPGFPFPFKTMIGGWEVVPNEVGSTVNLWFEMTPKYGFAHPIILALMSKDLAGNFGEVVARMAAASRGEAIPAKPSLSQLGISSKLAPC